MSIRVVGLDLSLTSTGVARLTIDDDGTPRTNVEAIPSQPTGRTVTDRGARLGYVTERVLHTAFPTGSTAAPALVLVEAPTYGERTTGSAHDRAGLWWSIVRGLQLAGITVHEVHPTHLKIYATGKGRAAKPRVIDGARMTWGQWFDLAPGPGLDDRADAVTLAALAAHIVGHPLVPLADDRGRAVAMTRIPTAHTHRKA